MACALSPISSTAPRDGGRLRRSLSSRDLVGLRRSLSSRDLHRRGVMRRSYSDNHLSHSLTSIKAASTVQPNTRSAGFFNIQLSDTFKSLLFDPPSKEMKDHDVDEDEDDEEEEMGVNETKKRANWIERLMELRSSWKVGKEERVERYDDGSEGCDEGCGVEYEEDGGGEEIIINREIFSSLLTCVSWSDTRLFSQLAFLCNMAYAISDMKTEDLRRYCGLEFVTSSLEMKAEAAAAMDTVEETGVCQQKTRSRAYGIAASAASYVQYQAKDVIMLEDEEEGRMHKSEMAATVAASTMTAVVAAGEEQKDKAAKDLQSLHSSTCEWFVCDDSSIYTRRFVIQGSDSLASWQANLFFEPTKFEGTNVLVHRGIYEAAKGIYDQFMPLIKLFINMLGFYLNCN